MNRWILVSGALGVALLVALGSGVALSQLGAGAGSGRTVVMTTATPGALEQEGVRLTAAALPPGCGLPVRLPGCPVTKPAAEAAATKFLGIGAQAAIRESVLARVDISSNPGIGRSIHGLEWVVAVDGPSLPIGAMMCVRPITPARAPISVTRFGAGRFLVFVDAASGSSAITITRP